MKKTVTSIMAILFNIKASTYQFIGLLVLSLLVPGTLVMFYFYRGLFESYDLIRVFLLIVGISTALIVISKFTLDGLMTRFYDAASEKESEGIDLISSYVSFRASLLNSIVSLSICYISGWQSKLFFAALYLTLTLLFSIAVRAYFNSLINKRAETKTGNQT